MYHGRPGCVPSTISILYSNFNWIKLIKITTSSFRAPLQFFIIMWLTKNIYFPSINSIIKYRRLACVFWQYVGASDKMLMSQQHTRNVIVRSTLSLCLFCDKCVNNSQQICVDWSQIYRMSNVVYSDALLLDRTMLELRLAYTHWMFIWTGRRQVDTLVLPEIWHSTAYLRNRTGVFNHFLGVGEGTRTPSTWWISSLIHRVLTARSINER